MFCRILMKTYSLSLLLIGSSIITNAQHKTLQFGLVGGFGFSGYSTNFAQSSYRPSQSYELGINIRKTLKVKMDFRGGLTYTRLATRFFFYDISGNDYTYKPNSLKMKHLEFSLEVPLGLNCYFSERPSSFYLTGGMKPGTYLFSKMKSSYESINGEEVKESSSYRGDRVNRIGLKLYSGFGWLFLVNSKTLYIEPIFSHSLPLFGKRKHGFYPYSFFINSGIYF